VLDKEERRTNTASASCLAAGNFIPSFERVVVGLSSFVLTLLYSVGEGLLNNASWNLSMFFSCCMSWTV
jgi:hypothetical protein